MAPPHLVCPIPTGCRGAFLVEVVSVCVSIKIRNSLKTTLIYRSVNVRAGPLMLRSEQHGTLNNTRTHHVDRRLQVSRKSSLSRTLIFVINHLDFHSNNIEFFFLSNCRECRHIIRLLFFWKMALCPNDSALAAHSNSNAAFLYVHISFGVVSHILLPCSCRALASILPSFPSSPTPWKRRLTNSFCFFLKLYS